MLNEGRRHSWGPDDLLAYERVEKASNVAKIALISRDPDALRCNLRAGPSDERNPSWWWPEP